MLNKTEKGRAEFTPGQRTLGQRERAVLLMADGRRRTPELQSLFGGQGEAIVESLLAQGYLVSEAPQRVATPAALAPKSMASVRMFLFDLCERTFAAADRAQTQRLREALREAKDVPDMLQFAHTMLHEIEQVAGADRADTVRRQLAELLPNGLLSTA